MKLFYLTLLIGTIICAGIEEVYIIRHIMALGDGWLTEREVR